MTKIISIITMLALAIIVVRTAAPTAGAVEAQTQARLSGTANAPDPVGANSPSGSVASLITNGPAFHDANIAAFIASNHITDPSAQMRLFTAAAFAKQVGLWPWLNDVRLLHSTYNPTGNVSLFLKPWTVINPNYSCNGFVQTGTNSQWGPLRVPIAEDMPHTEIWVRQVTPQYVETISTNAVGLSFFIQYHFIGGVAAADNREGVFANAFTGGSVALNEHAGPSNAWSNSRGAPAYGDIRQTNAFTAIDLNGPTSRLVAGLKFDVFTAADHVHRAWENGLPMVCGPRTATCNNAWTSGIQFTNTLVNFLIGSNTDYNFWDAYGPISAQEPLAHAGNAMGEETLLVAVLNTNADQRLVHDINTFCAMLLPQREVTIVTGTSMINPANSGGAGRFPDPAFRPYNNSIAYLRQKTFPDLLTVEWASPGSTIAEQLDVARGDSMGEGRGYAWLGQRTYPVWFIADLARAGKHIIFETDDGRNDLGAGADWQEVMARFNRLYSERLAAANGQMEIRYIGTPFIDPGRAAEQVGQNAVYNTNGLYAVHYGWETNFTWTPGSNDVAWSTNAGVGWSGDAHINVTPPPGDYWSRTNIILRGKPGLPVTANVTAPGAFRNTEIQNSNIWAYAHAMQTNPLVKVYSMPIEVLTTDDVRLMSYGAAHLDTPYGYQFTQQEMLSLENYGYQFFNVTNPAVKYKRLAP